MMSFSYYSSLKVMVERKTTKNPKLLQEQRS